MKRLALLLAAVTTFAALADPVPPPRPKCSAESRAGKGTVCQECKPAVCAELSDGGYTLACKPDCAKAPCFEVWCKAPAAKAKAKN